MNVPRVKESGVDWKTRTVWMCEYGEMDEMISG